MLLVFTHYTCAQILAILLQYIIIYVYDVQKSDDVLAAATAVQV